MKLEERIMLTGLITFIIIITDKIMEQLKLWEKLPDTPKQILNSKYYASETGKIYSLKVGSHYKELKPSNSKDQPYLSVTLTINKKSRTYTVHQLMAIAFKGHVPSGHDYVVDHINHNKQDNHIENLRIITQRQNSDQKHLQSASRFTGVYWTKSKNKWYAQIAIQSAQFRLGTYDKQYSAHLNYEIALLFIKHMKKAGFTPFQQKLFLSQEKDLIQQSIKKDPHFKIPLI